MLLMSKHLFPLSFTWHSEEQNELQGQCLHQDSEDCSHVAMQKKTQASVCTHISMPLLVTVIAHALQTQCEDLFSNTYVSVVSLCCLHRFGVFEKLSVIDLNYVLDQLKIFLKV